MKNSVFVLFFFLFLQPLAAFAAQAPAAPGPAVITSDTLWSGVVRVEGKVTVQKGSTLTIAPGTVIIFSDKGDEKGGLDIFGRIIARGTDKRRIVFTSGKKEKDAWDEIFINSAGPSVISWADFRHASWGLHVHFTHMEISHCRFIGNEGGIRFRSGPMLIEQNLFTQNHIGIRAYFGEARITDNTISGNKVGIFVSQGPEGLRISGNNIAGNAWYNLRIGDFEPKPVQISGNWWGSPEKSAVEAGIYDKRRDSHVGEAIFKPFLASPVENSPAIGQPGLLAH
ncbi:MAG: right-handed parallel beta-helix repeat-containing protein [Nitrospiraceae bacterium]|nr:right-handed parallel beta-helix repeat-containing protein [Nitrospiraceae bacterium]